MRLCYIMLIECSEMNVMINISLALTDKFLDNSVKMGMESYLIPLHVISVSMKIHTIYYK